MTTPTNEPTPEPTPAVTLQQLADAFTQSAYSSTAPTLSHLDQLQQLRVDRLTAAADRLKASLGADNPRVIALTQSALGVSSLQQSLQVEAVRVERQPVIGPNEWLVYGRVLDNQGQAVAGVNVRVFDKDRKYDDLLGDTTTDELGDFSAIYHERDFAEAREANPDLYVMVSDSAGNLLFSSKDNIRFEAGRVEYFEIVLIAPQPAVKMRTVRFRSSPGKAKTMKTGRRGRPRKK